MQFHLKYDKVLAMKKLKKISLIVLIPIIVGVILLIVGNYTKNKPVFSAGQLILSAGTFVTMFILVVICLILVMTGKLEDGKSEKKKEERRKREEEDSDSDEDERPSREEEIKDFSKRAGKRYKNSTDKEKILGWLFFGFLMTDFFLIPVFAFFQIYIGALVCFCLFVGTILMCFLVAVVFQNCSIKFQVRKLDKLKLLTGQVKECRISNAGDGRKTRRNSTTKKEKCKVIVSADGKDYVAYSENCLEKNEIVVISVKRGRRASIVDIESLREKVKRIKEEFDIKNNQGKT